MRVSPVAWVAGSLEEALAEGEKSARVTHNHPNGIKGAQAVAGGVFLARMGKTKEEIRTFIETQFGYDLNRTVDQVRPGYIFEVSCEYSVPEAISAFLDSSNFEDAIRKAISFGGDSDTIACIAGAFARAFYRKIPDRMTHYCLGVLDLAQRSIIKDFWERFPPVFGSLSE